MAQYKSPTGVLIDGTLERISARAIITEILDDGTPVYAGDTEIWWDEQRTATRDGKLLFVDEQGFPWTFDQLVKVEDEHLPDCPAPDGLACRCHMIANGLDAFGQVSEGA